MYARAVSRIAPVAPAASVASAVAALAVGEHDHDAPGVALPGPEVHLVVRFGPSALGGLDAHALGGRKSVHRKILRRGLRVVTARLHLGVTQAVLGVPASAVAGRIVALEDLWGSAAARQLGARLAESCDLLEASAILEGAIARRFAAAGGPCERTRFVVDAAGHLTSAHVNAVAHQLGVSERHLRRVFHETIGVSPKTFAQLMRFRRAVSAARADSHPSWATIATGAGYYDQAHLISEFRAIAGVTPRALLTELRAAQSFG